MILGYGLIMPMTMPAVLMTVLMCKNLDLRLRTVLAEIADRLASDGGEFGERAEPVKDAKHRLGGGPSGRP